MPRIWIQKNIIYIKSCFLCFQLYCIVYTAVIDVYWLVLTVLVVVFWDFFTLGVSSYAEIVYRVDLVIHFPLYFVYLVLNFLGKGCLLIGLLHLKIYYGFLQIKIFLVFAGSWNLSFSSRRWLRINYIQFPIDYILLNIVLFPNKYLILSFSW